jgi:hypothetical protein
MRELAKRTGFNENYTSQIVDLAVLLPKMTEAISGGNHDPSLTVAQPTANLRSIGRQRDCPRSTISDRKAPRMSMLLYRA